MPEGLLGDYPKNVVAAFGLSSRLTEYQSWAERPSREERQTFRTLFCDQKQYPERLENIRQASAFSALEMVEDPNNRFELALAAYDAGQELKSIAMGIMEGTEQLTKAQYDKYAGAIIRAAANQSEFGTDTIATPAEQDEAGRLAMYAQNILADGEIIVEYTDQSDAKTRSRTGILGRLATWWRGYDA